MDNCQDKRALIKISIRWLFALGDIKKNVDNAPHVPLFEKL